MKEGPEKLLRHTAGAGSHGSRVSLPRPSLFHLSSRVGGGWMIPEAWKGGGGGPQRHLHGEPPVSQLSYLPSPADLVSIYTPVWLPRSPDFPLSGPLK